MDDVKHNRSMVVVGETLQKTLDLGVPWLTTRAVGFLSSLDLSQHSCFEYGGGASTLFWLRNCEEVFTLEASYIWALALIGKIGESPELMAKWRLHFINCDYRYDDLGELYTRGTWRENPQELTKRVRDLMEESYFNVDPSGNNIIVLDGQFRSETVKRVLSKVDLSQTDLIVIDNTEKKATKSAVEENLPDSFLRVDLMEEDLSKIPDTQNELITTVLVRKESTMHSNLEGWLSTRETLE